jgi:hypothetical protein
MPGQSTGTDRVGNPPAELTWTQHSDTFHWTTYRGQRWAIHARSAWLGKSGWSGTNEWHLDPIVSTSSFVTKQGRWLVSAGRGARITKVGTDRAKRLAAWILANQATADRMTMTQIHETVLS